MIDSPVAIIEQPNTSETGSPAPVCVLYIAGEGRSGSTLLGDLAGELPGCAHVGEMGYFWYQSGPPAALCGCGAAFDRCEFWTEVVKRAFGGFANIDLHAMCEAKRFLEDIRMLPLRAAQWKSLCRRPEVGAYLTALAALYQAIREVSGAKVIVDGSKAPAYTLTLERMAEIDLRVAHLVRDSRAVAYSWQRTKRDPANESFMPKRPPIKAALRWSVFNSAMHLLKPGGGQRYIRLRYEDLVNDPKSALGAVCRLIETPDASLDFLDAEPIKLRTQHSVNGNPDRFSRTITLRKDFEWKERMRPAHRAIVTALTLPLLLRYGYAAKINRA